jgi:hypothetical protein
MHVLLAQVDNNSYKEDAKHQDHNATVTKNIMLKLTHVLHVNQDNFHRIHLVVDKILNAKHTVQVVLKEDNFN